MLRRTNMSGRQRVGGRGRCQSCRSAVRCRSRVGARIADAHARYDVGIAIEEGLFAEEGQAGILPDSLHESTWGTHANTAAPMLSAEPILISDLEDAVMSPVKTGMSGVAFATQLQQKQKVVHPDMHVVHCLVSTMLNKVQR
ncbi:hypothetical protein NDU88_007070 [Pleurodeles waltl]|uniref:Uncharacterized protein n=1 Tax=Pleurodeles waltl TaxID=8319 RepID=A0AAV7RP16_PLEWA|nr:hypothetical protein NDU88_007070 [Pleurodeles waltl]